MPTAYAMIKGFEVMGHCTRDRRERSNITGDGLGEVRLVERAFNLGLSALAQAVNFIGQRIQAA